MTYFSFCVLVELIQTNHFVKSTNLQVKQPISYNNLMCMLLLQLFDPEFHSFVHSCPTSGSKGSLHDCEMKRTFRSPFLFCTLKRYLNEII